jgi:hypothetical protein
MGRERTVATAGTREQSMEGSGESYQASQNRAVIVRQDNSHTSNNKIACNDFDVRS